MTLRNHGAIVTGCVGGITWEGGQDIGSLSSREGVVAVGTCGYPQNAQSLTEATCQGAQDQRFPGGGGRVTVGQGSLPEGGAQDVRVESSYCILFMCVCVCSSVFGYPWRPEGDITSLGPRVKKTSVSCLIGMLVSGPGSSDTAARALNY